jgi:hypothetical protein
LVCSSGATFSVCAENPIHPDFRHGLVDLHDSGRIARRGEPVFIMTFAAMQHQMTTGLHNRAKHTMPMSWMETVRYIGLDLQLMTVLAVAGVILAVRAFESVRRRGTLTQPRSASAVSERNTQRTPSINVTTA